MRHFTFPNSTSAHEQFFLSNATLDCLSVRLIASSGSSKNGSDPPFLPLALDRLWSPDASNLKNLESNPSKVHFFEVYEFHIVYFVQAILSMPWTPGEGKKARNRIKSGGCY